MWSIKNIILIKFELGQKQAMVSLCIRIGENDEPTEWYRDK